ncbi:MAG: hypothetical protein IT221_07920 [Fluviicola sp.]|jgi:hypothetical protein|nr:hypothetical protein [Fluviicola sp.]
MELDKNEKKIEKMKQDFILALKDLSKSVELNSQFDKDGRYLILSKEELKAINKLRGRMKKAYDISRKLKAIDRFKDLHYLLDDKDPIVVTYYCKFNYPNYAEVFVPVLFKHLKECPRGMWFIEISQALREFGASADEIDKIRLNRNQIYDT